MLTRIVMLDGLEQTFDAPVINKIANDINKRIFMDGDAFFNLETPYEKENAGWQDYNYDNGLGGSNIDISYELTDNEDLRLSLSTPKPINNPIIIDPDNGFIVRPIYIDTDINIKIGYRGQSKTKMNRILNKLKTLYYTTGSNYTHELPYSYLLPPVLISLMYDIYKLKQPTYDFYDYLKVVAKTEFDLAIKRGSGYKVPAFRGKQVNVFGNIMSEPTNISIEKQDVPEYSLEFDYLVTVQRPIALLVQYPIIVNNKPLNKIWLPKETVAKPVEYANEVLDIENIIGNYYRTLDTNMSMYRVPTYDQFSPVIGKTFKGYITFLSVLLQIDENDPYTIFNINDLKYIGVPNEIINYMKKRKNGLFNLGTTALLIELYEYNYKKDLGLYVDDDLNIKTTKPMDIEKPYHLVFSFIYNMGLMEYNSKPDSEYFKEDIKLLERFGIDWYNEERVIVSQIPMNNN